MLANMAPVSMLASVMIMAVTEHCFGAMDRLTSIAVFKRAVDDGSFAATVDISRCRREMVGCARYKRPPSCPG